MIHAALWLGALLFFVWLGIRIIEVGANLGAYLLERPRRKLSEKTINKPGKGWWRHINA